jgi:acyl transferase domain-containing protein/acyl carrier protein/NAD(P)-dependent dehydrogenase (short-subunit alcohol dehydrogenase family)
MKDEKDPIAIVGMSSLFPQAENLQQFWNNIFTGHDAITDVPETHWRIDDYYDADPNAEDKTYCRRGGFLPATAFNPVEFGIPPNALDVIDVLQLLSLNVAKSTLYDAGYFETEKFQTIKERVGVVLGITGANSLTQPLSNRLQSPKIRLVLKSRGLNDEQIEDVVETLKKSYAPWEENSFPGMLGNVVAGRIANRFDLGGINCTIDAACASSLAALRMAIDELDTGRADMMLVGGCDAENTILMYMCFSKTPAFSRRGVISPFDSESDGTLIGEGMGILALKRLSDAERDGDRIYAVIKGLGASSDGKFKSIYAPRKEGQIKCLNRAYEDAGFPIGSVGLLEAHGTGTKVGDATEISALQEVIGKGPAGRIALGSVKSQIGHTKAAAGSAGLIKMALSLYHKVIPPTINIEKPVDVLSGANSPLYVNVSARPWLLNYGADKRRAGISSFGFGGTNFHAVLEEYSVESRLISGNALGRRLHAIGYPVVIAVDSIFELRSRLTELTKCNDWSNPPPFDEITDQVLRLGFVARSLDHLRFNATIALESLDKNDGQKRWHHPKGIYFDSGKRLGKVAALFSGQGSQYVNMAKMATMAYPAYMNMLEIADKHFHQTSGDYLSNKIYPPVGFTQQTFQNQELLLRETRFAQPAIGCVSAAAFVTLTGVGFKADCVAGHSFGELTALWAAGVLSNEDFLKLAIARGAAMSPRDGQNDCGTMAAVSASGELVEKFIAESKLSQIYLCNLNTDSQSVVGGPVDTLAQFGRFLADKSIQFTPLPVSAAFHTPFVAHAQQSFAADVDLVEFNQPEVPLYRCKDGKPVTDAALLKLGLKQQLLEPVYFANIIRQMISDGVRVFVEFGPKGHLTKMVDHICQKEGTQVSVISLDNGRPEDSAELLNSALVQLAVAGVPMRSLSDFEPDYKDAPRKTGFNVTMTGINYVSDNRKKAWEESLVKVPDDVWRQPHSTPWSRLQHSPNVTAIHSNSHIEKETSMKSPSQQDTETKPHLNNQIMTLEKPQAIDLGDRHSLAENESLAMLRSLQDSNAGVHAAYLEQLNQTASQTLSVISRLNDSSPQQLSHINGLAEQGLQIVADGQHNTSESHQQFLRYSVELASLAFGSGVDQLGVRSSPLLERTAEPLLSLAQSPRAAVANLEPQGCVLEALDESGPDLPTTASTNAPTIAPTLVTVSSAPVTVTPAPETISPEEVERVLMAVVSEKTGYPLDVLDTSMDMEADLGIDSIKRVEILGEMQKTLPGITQFQPERMAEARTLKDIINMAARVASSSVISSTANKVADDSVVKSVSVEQVTAIFLAIVAEKTGYPQDVLEMSMSLEADLGIDSIKRVEILGDLQTKLQLGDGLNAATLGELSTLGDIASFIGTQISNAGESPPAVHSGQAPTAGAEILSAALITQALLRIVSEKTGYPEDVIDLDMDIEADLGVDSIKRVEILGGLQTLFPALPAPSPEQAGELRTLRQIVAHLGGKSNDVEVFVETTMTEIQNETQNAFPSDVPTVLDRSSAIRRHDVGLCNLGSVEPLQGCYQIGSRVLLVNFETSDLKVIHREMTQAGFDLHTLTLGAGGEALVNNHYYLLNSSEPSLFKFLEELPEMDAVIYQHPKTQSALGAISDQNNEVASLKVLLLLAKYFKARLDVGGDSRKAFFALARLDGRLGLTKPDSHFMAAGCFGLVKTLAMETKHLFCRTLDVDPSLDDLVLAKQLVAELNDHNINYTDVGLSEYGRCSFKIVPQTTATGITPLPKDTCFVVTGGARGITAACIKGLARKQPGKYLLLGRTPFDINEPSWSIGVGDADLKTKAAAYLKQLDGKATPKAISQLVNQVVGWREIKSTIADLEHTGVTARYVAVDINDVDAVSAWAKSDPWLLNSNDLALIHGAGALADKLIENKQLVEMKQVFSVKLYGVSNLLNHIALDKLRLCCLFSSVAGLFGNIGQVDYAMANEVLNRISLQVQSQMSAGGRSHSIIWGAWNAGMVTPQIKKLFESRGISLIEIEQGVNHFVDICLGSSKSHLQMVGPSSGLASRKTDFSTLVGYKSSVLLSTNSLRNTKLLRDHSLAGEILMPATFAIGWVARVIEDMFAGVVVMGCERVNVNKGIILNDATPEHLLLILEVKSVDGDNSVCLDASIRNLSNGMIHYSYKNIALSHALPSVSSMNVAIEFTQENAGELYRNKTLFHGVDFQLLKSYQSTAEKELLFSAQWLPDDEQSIVEGCSAKAFCPMSADALLQAALVWVKEYEGLPSLPMMVENLRCFGQIQPGEVFYIRVGLVSQSDSQTTVHLDGLKRDGQVLLAMNASVVKSNSLAEKFLA